MAKRTYLGETQLIKLKGEELDEAKSYVSLFQDQFKKGEPGYGPIDAFDWFRSRRSKHGGFILWPQGAQILGQQSDWATWMEQELWNASEDGLDIWNWMLDVTSIPQTWDEIIVVEGADGMFYLWDGHHRVGAAAMRDILQIPAIIGLRQGGPG